MRRGACGLHGPSGMTSKYARSPRSLLAAIVLAGTFLSAGCREDGAAEAEVADGAPDPAAVAPDTADEGIFIAEEDHVDERPETIYYDLTRFDWYARGEPLMHEGRAFVAGGTLVAAPLSAMERIGEYGGVAYYRRPEVAGVLFVPVYDRYWLQFRAQEAAPAGG